MLKIGQFFFLVFSPPQSVQRTAPFSPKKTLAHFSKTSGTGSDLGFALVLGVGEFLFV